MEQHALGFNYRLSDLQSALGRSQLAKLERVHRRPQRDRRPLPRRARRTWRSSSRPRRPTARCTATTCSRPLRTATTREALYDGLRERGILAQVHFIPVYWHPWYRETYGYARGLCPAAEDYYDGCLSLPCFPALTAEEQGTVIAAVRELAR